MLFRIANEIGCLAWFCSKSSGVRDRRAPDYATRQWPAEQQPGGRRLVAREGSAPPISGCRPDVILFHHRAEIGCGSRVRTDNYAFKERRVAGYSIPQEMVEPEVVATSPYRIKSPVPVCCGFSSRKVVLAAGFAPALATFSTSCLFCWTTRAKTNGASRRCCPGATFLQRKPAAAARRRNGRSLQCCPGHSGLMKPA